MAVSAIYGWPLPDGPDAPNVPYWLAQLGNAIAATLSAAGAPIGAVVAFGGSTAPANWHLCDGSTHGSAALQTIIGSALTPDLRGRFVLAANTGHPAGQTGGEESHTLTIAEMPSHNHKEIGHITPLVVGGGSTSHVYGADDTAAVTDAAGGGGGHNNMPPFYALTYIIKKA